MGQRLRLACLGDSWVCDWLESLGDWKINTPMPLALRDGLEASGFEVELVVAGFPGATVERILELARICRLRDMASLSASGRSIKGDLMAKLDEFGLQRIPKGAHQAGSV